MAPVVRTRPKLPTLAPSVSPGRDTVSPASSNGQPEDLSGVISALGSTDFIGKYSRRRRSGAPSPVPPSAAMSPASPVISPGVTTPPHDGRGMGTVTLTRMRSIKLKLEKVKERREQEDNSSSGLKEEEPSRLPVGGSRSPSSRSPSSRTDERPQPTNATDNDLTHNHADTRKSPATGDTAEVPAGAPDPSVTTLAGHASPPHRDPSRSKSPRHVDTSTCAHADGVRSDTPELNVTEHSEDADVGGTMPVVTHCYILEQTQLPKAEFKAVDMDIDEGVGDTDIDSDLSVSVPSLPQSHPSDTEEACPGGHGTLQKRGSVKSPRFLTHPITGSERTEQEEGGSMDSNGLCSLRHIAAADENVSVMDSSASASTDSHLDTPDDQSLRDLVIRDTPERAMTPEKPEKKNGKGLKPKSKSDPSAEKASQSESADFTPLSTTAQSTPVLSSLKDMSSQDTESDSSVKERRKSKSDDILSKEGSNKDSGKDEGSEESSHSLARSLFKPRKISRKSKRVALKTTETKDKDKSRKGKGAAISIISEGEEDQREKEERADSLEDIPSGVKKRAKGFRSFTAPTSPTSLSPDHTLEKKTLTLPMSKKASSSLARSHSSASVLLHKDRSGVPSKDTRASQQDLSSEGKLKDKAIGSYSPKLEPIFASSTLSLFDGPQEDKVSPHTYVTSQRACRPGPRLNIKTVLSTYGDFHVKDKTAVRTSYL